MKWVKILSVVLNACVTASDLKATTIQYMSEKDDRAALLHIIVAAEPGYFGINGVTLVLKQLASHECIRTIDLMKMFGDIKQHVERYNRMKPKNHVDTDTVATFAVSAFCDNPAYGNSLIIQPDTDDVPFDNPKVIVLKYYYTYVKLSQVPEPP